MRLAIPWLLVLILPAFVLLRVFRARRLRAVETGRVLMAGSRLGELAPGLADGRARWKGLLVAMATLFVIGAMARPQFGTRFTQVKKEGIDIVFAIDTSLSMTAEDLRPSRLERARLEIEALLPRLGGNRVGIVAFAGAAFVQCPLTLDHGALRLFLDALSPDLIPRPGTDVAAAIRKAIRSFPSDNVASRVVVLLSDGEGFEGDAEKAADAADEQGIAIHAVGIGSPEGEPIPEYDSTGAKIGYKKNGDGQTIMSRLDEATLSRVALATGGRYYRVSGGGFALDEVMNEIAAMTRKETESRFVAEYEERFQLPLLVAVLLLIVDAGIVLARRSVVGALLIVLLVTGVSPARGQEASEIGAEGDRLYQEGDFEGALNAYKQAAIDEPERADLEFNVGTALFKLGRTDEAAHKLERAAEKATEEPTIERNAHYNRGVTRMAAQQFDAAVDAFQSALDIDPGDGDALFNLELALRKLQEQQEQEEEQQQEQEEEQEKQDQEQQNQEEEEEEQEEEERQEEQEGEEEGDEEEPAPQPESDSLQVDPQLAEQILDAIAEDEEDLHKQRARWAIPASDMPEKDW
ncbi:MAG: hypothetical protein CME06_01575 [Gemmatimonadetes bacterium]|nr:hypothetical protein [Gemmatimonadota bacterium]